MMLKNKSQIHTSKARKSTSLPAETVDYLKAWMMSPEHIEHPYPTDKEKAQIMADTGIGLKPLTNWFVNNRKRYWKPRVEARLQKQKAESLLTIPNSSDSLSETRQYLGRRARLGPVYSPGAAPRAVSIGSASSLSSESSDSNSFDDDDSITFITFGSKKVRVDLCCFLSCSFTFYICFQKVAHILFSTHFGVRLCLFDSGWNYCRPQTY